MTRFGFADLVIGHVEELTAYALRTTRTKWDADDLLQDTYERAFRARKELRDPANARAWLFRIARNTWIDRLRSGAARVELRVIEGAEVDLAVALRSDTVERTTATALDAALRSLPGEQAEVVLLCDLWGFRYDEIAAIVDAPTGTVRSRIARGRAAIAERLMREGFEARGKRGQLK